MRNNLVNAAFQAILDNTTDMMFIKDTNLKYVAASMSFVKMVGKEKVEEIIDRTDLEIFEDENLAKRYMDDDQKLLKEGKSLIDYMEPLTDNDGQARYGSTSKYILFDNKGETIGIMGVTKDITREYIARLHYQQELKYLFRLPQDFYAVSYIDIDSWRIISQRRQYINDSTLKSCHTLQALCEDALASIADKRSDVAKFYRNFSPEILRDIYAGGRNHFSFVYERRFSDDSTRWVHNEVKFLTDLDSGHLCVMLTAKDIDAKKREEEELLVAARMDKMTMVLNRETTMDYIERTLIENDDQMHVLFMIDVDNFKAVNDTLGHQAGDEFLISFATEIRKIFRESDIVGRIGGDEFFALMKKVSGNSKEIEKKAQQILNAIHKASVGYPEVNLTGSIGISLYPRDGKNLEELYAQADTALYEAKNNGKNQFVIASAKKIS